MALLDKFPGSPRPQQQYAIPKIEEAIKKGYKYIIIQAPTGSGKSHIGANLAYSTNSKANAKKLAEGELKFGSYVLSITTQLQEQYSELFPDSSILMGKSNYVCEKDGISPCNHGVCALNRSVISDCMETHGCLYFDAYKDAVNNKFSILNYNMFLSLPSRFRHRDMLICDEATELEGALINMHAIDIKYESWANLYDIPISPLRTDNPKAVYGWLTGLFSEVKIKLSSLSTSGTKAPASKDIHKYQRIKDISERLVTVLNTWNSGHYVIELYDGGVKLAPLQAKSVSHNLFDYADTVVLMSATICNHRKFADTLGIAEKDYCFIDVESNFDPKKSPIYSASAVHDMTYANIRRSMPSMVRDVCAISEMHSTEKGIIHTHNFNILNAIKQSVGNNPRFLFRGEGMTNDDLLFEHYMNPDPTVIVSPSLAFGTSLDDDFGRFQVLCKLPHLPLGDKRIKTLLKMDQDWYTMKMLITMIQASGRCTRSVDDYCKTYVMDKAFTNTVLKNQRIIPSWFIDRIK